MVLALTANLLIALTGIMCAHLLGIASIPIGRVLAAVATFIAVEVKALLIGEAAHDETQQGIRRIIEDERARDGRIVAINETRTLQLGSLVTASVGFDHTTRARDSKTATNQLETAIRAAYPDLQEFYVQVMAAADHAAMQAKDGTASSEA